MYSVSGGFIKGSGISGKLKSNIDFRCRRCLEEGPVETALQREVEIEPNVKLECVPKFCYLCDNPNSAIWVTHLVQEEVWTRQLELVCDVLGLSSRSYRPF